MWFLSGALLATVGLAMSAQAQSNIVYGVEYKQKTNRFGTINLLNGSFTKISSFGSMVINDIAYCPTNGTLYGISNTTALVTFNKTNGAITRVASLSVSGIESLAFRPSDGTLFGATQSKLYSINPANGTATSIGSYGSPKNLGTTGQNIRFAQDGNLYVSNTSTNTDIYRINTTSGAATWMGEAIGYPYLMLQNASSNMYGVFISLGSGASNATPVLVNFNLASFVNGGTNANGSTHQITVTIVGGGTNFPANFNFSGNVPQAITNLTVPVSATGPSNQTVVAGGNVVFSTTASGTGPYNYAWSKNGAAISGQTSSSLTLNNVTTTNAATYSVIVGGAMGTVTNSATLTVTKASATVALGSLNQTYNGAAKPATATTTPNGLAVVFTYNGSATTPTNAGSYVVIGTINDANYQGSATNTLVIAQATATVALGSLSQTYDGAAKPATATTTPTGLAVTFTYNGSATAPTGAGNYTVIGTINNANYQGSATNTLVIAQASATVALGSLSQTYDGSAKPSTAITTPNGLAVTFTYNGSATAPTGAGNYTVIGTINNANYQGSATNTLVIAQASATVALGSLSQTYDGSAKPATATTTPTGWRWCSATTARPLSPTNAGSYVVIGTINDANYQGSATNTLVISPVTLTVTADNKTKIYGMANPPLTACYNGFVGGENTNVLSSLVVLNTTATDKCGPGKYPITASGATADNYAVNFVDGTLRVVSTPEVAIASISKSGAEQHVLNWATVAGQTYQLEYTTNLGASWAPMGTPFAGTDGIVAVTNSINSPQCFFRIMIQPSE